MEMRKLSRATLTKRITYSMIVIGTIAGFTPFILSLFERDPVTELGIAWVTGVVCTVLGYFIRGFKDTKALKEQKLNERKLEYRYGKVDVEDEEYDWE